MKTLFEQSQNNAKTKPVKERIKTFEDACLELGISKIEFGLTGMDEDVENITAYTKLIVIVKALNEGWKPDWKNGDQYKYYPWFKESGSGLSFDGAGYWGSGTDVGSRLCFKSRELAEYAATQFEDIYKEFMSL